MPKLTPEDEAKITDSVKNPAQPPEPSPSRGNQLSDEDKEFIQTNIFKNIHDAVQGNTGGDDIDKQVQVWLELSQNISDAINKPFAEFGDYLLTEAKKEYLNITKEKTTDLPSLDNDVLSQANPTSATPNITSTPADSKKVDLPELDQPAPTTEFGKN